VELMYYCCRLCRKLCRDAGRDWRPVAPGMTPASDVVCSHEYSELISHDFVCNNCRVSYYRERRSVTQLSQTTAHQQQQHINTSATTSSIPLANASTSSPSQALSTPPPLLTSAVSYMMGFWSGWRMATDNATSQPNAVTASLSVPMNDITNTPTNNRKRKRARYSLKIKRASLTMTPAELAAEGITERQRKIWREQEAKLNSASNMSKFRLAGGGRKEVFYHHPELKKELLDKFSKLRSYGIILRSAWMIIFMTILIQQRAPELINQYNLDQSWFNKWMREHGHWTRRTGSTCMKLPSNWEELRDKTVNRAAYLRVKHNVHPRLIVNLDQTSILYLPTINSQTWTEKYTDNGYIRPKISSSRAAEILSNENLTHRKRREMIRKENNALSPRKKETPVDGHGGKKAISTVVGMSFSGDLLPLQMIYTGKTTASLPNSANEYVRLARAADWILTTKEKNHWSSADTMMTYIRNVLIPYREKIIREENLPSTQREIILLIDCWSMHVHTLKPQIEREFPFIHILFVPANCTSKLQPCDVIANAPLKKRFKSQCIQWTAERAAQAIANDISPSAYKIAAKVSLTQMKPLLIEWLYKSWIELSLTPELLQIGWAKCGFGNLMFITEAKVAEMVTQTPEIADVLYSANLKRKPKASNTVDTQIADEGGDNDDDDGDDDHEENVDDVDTYSDGDDGDDVNDIDVDGRGNNDIDPTALSDTLRQTQEILELLERRQQAEKQQQDQPPPSLSSTSSVVSRRERVNRSNVENEPPTRQSVNADVMNTATRCSSQLLSSNVRRSQRLSR
jgi:hypothetical protein